jgi:hypothetical protein
MNFQKTFTPEETFKTTTGVSIKPFDQRTEPFKLKETALTSDPDKLKEYREKWTHGNHNFGRTYLGAPAWTKSQQE